jgi:putative ABC transport system permease protein
MIRNYLKIALRQLNRQKTYSAIKIGGFALSIAVCILIIFYIRSEESYDRSYPAANRIYRLVSTVPVEGKPFRNNYMPAPVAGVYKQNFPEVENAGRIMSDPEFPGAGSNEVRTAGQVQNTYEEGFTYADQEMLDILQIPMVYGDRSKALTTPHTIVLSKRKADKYFPGQDPVGKTLYLNNDVRNPYVIGGVMQDPPVNSHIQYDFWLSLKGVELFPGEQTTWQANNYDVYVLLRPGTNPAAFEKKSTALIFSRYLIPAMKEMGMKNVEASVQGAAMSLQPITDIHLKSNDIHDDYTHGDIRFVWLFGAIASFILIIAAINFINLSTARSANRAKEVGLRKVVGSTRYNLIGQFLSESLLFSLLSFIAGVFLAWLMLPYFNLLAGKSLGIPWQTVWFIPGIFGAALVVGLLAGLYPAFYLSGFNPAAVLKGKISMGSKGSLLRSGLVVFQFSISIILIVSTIVVYNQMEYILHKDLGYNKDQVLMIQGTNVLDDNSLKTLRQNLLNLPAVKSVTASNYLPVEGTTRSGNLFYTLSGKEKDVVGGQIWQVDPGYLSTLGIRLVAGRNFSPIITGDSQAVVINQSLASSLQLQDAVGQAISVGGKRFNVIGVVADFNFESLHDHIGPLCMQLGDGSSIVSVKINPDNMNRSIDAISAIWKQLSPAQPFRYTFLDERFALMYAGVKKIDNIFTSFALLAIFISSLGLFALAAFMAEQRTKEIGIRKVLGASVSGIVSMLSLDFVKLVCLAIVFAVPVAWWAMNQWLHDFAYRIHIGAVTFLLAGGVAILAAVLTVSFQAVKAATANPINCLKSE